LAGVAAAQRFLKLGGDQQRPSVEIKQFEFKALKRIKGRSSD
jgi:hypothetical protein